MPPMLLFHARATLPLLILRHATPADAAADFRLPPAPLLSVACYDDN